MHTSSLIIDPVGTVLNDDDKQVLDNPLVGGVILFKHNIESPKQVSELCASIKALRPDLFICVDQEGGRVQRLRNGFTRLPPMRTFGDLYDQNPEQARALTETCAWLMAQEVMSVGIDFSFAPVLDLDLGISSVIGNRAFHKDPKIAAELATIFCHGLYQAGTIAVGKHFPGHGGVAPDSHLEHPVDDRSLEQLAYELYPFEQLIKHELPAIMPAHITFTNIDNTLVTYSSHWLRTILRDQLGFKGVIISDDLTMAAAHDGTMAERVERTLQAGSDMVLICQNRDAVHETLANPPNYTPREDFNPQALKGRCQVTYDELMLNPNYQHAKKTISELTSD